MLQEVEEGKRRVKGRCAEREGEAQRGGKEGRSAALMRKRLTSQVVLRKKESDLSGEKSELEGKKGAGRGNFVASKNPYQLCNMLDNFCQPTVYSLPLFASSFVVKGNGSTLREEGS